MPWKVRYHTPFLRNAPSQCGAELQLSIMDLASVPRIDRRLGTPPPTDRLRLVTLVRCARRKTHNISPRALREPPYSSFAAVVIFSLPCLARVLSKRSCRTRCRFLSFSLPFLANTYLAGVAAGIKTSLASAIVATMLWIDPKRDLHLDSLAVLAIITFLVVGALNVVIIHLLREERECSQRLPHARGRWNSV